MEQANLETIVIQLDRFNDLLEQLSTNQLELTKKVMMLEQWCMKRGQLLEDLIDNDNFIIEHLKLKNKRSREQ